MKPQPNPLILPNKIRNIATAERALATRQDLVRAGAADAQVHAGPEDGVRRVVQAHTAHTLAVRHGGPGRLNRHAIDCSRANQCLAIRQSDESNVFSGSYPVPYKVKTIKGLKGCK